MAKAAFDLLEKRSSMYFDRVSMFAKATHEPLYRLVHNPEGYADWHVRLMADSFILNVTDDGLDVQSVNDSYIRMADSFHTCIS